MSGLSRNARARALKEATGELVKSVGGFEAAASYIEKGKSQVHRCASVNDPDSFMGLRDAAELERVAPEPAVTRMLCKLAGGVFLKLPEVMPGAEELPLLIMEGARELGEVSARVSDALDDGVVKPREAALIEVEIDDLIEWAVQVRAHLRALQGLPVASAHVAVPPQRGD